MSMGYDADYVRGKRPEDIAAEMTNLSNRRIAVSNRVLDVERALKSIVDMIDNCTDAPRDPSSLPMMIRRIAERAAKYHQNL